MLEKITLTAMLVFFLSSSLNATILDQAKWLLKAVERDHAEEVGSCVGHCLMASVDLAVLVFGWIDLMIENRIYRAHKARLKADTLMATKKNLEKLIWFLKNVERAFLLRDNKEITTTILQANFGSKFARALNEMRSVDESITDTIKRIHVKNQTSIAILNKIDISLDYHSTIRSSFCP